MKGEVTYVIIDLWSRIGELSELSWGWAHAQLTGVFWQQNLSALIHHQVGSSRFSTSSSSSNIQQLFREVDYSSNQRVSLSHRVTVTRDKAIRFPTYRVQNFRMLLPSSSEGYCNPSAHHLGSQQQLIYLIYILACTCIDFSYFIASQYFSRAYICMQLHACKVQGLLSYLIKE